MKSVLIIGMGKFGHHLCNNLVALGNDVMVVDNEEENVTDLIYKVTNVQIGDCTNPQVIKSLGVGNFDIVFVCIGTNFQSSLEVTSLVKEMGAKYVISKANRDVHAKFLLKNGADEVIYPDRDIAENLAKRCSADHVFDYMELDEDYSIYEIPVLQEWIGHSMKELNLRAKYRINIIGTKQEEKSNILPDPDYVFCQGEHLMVLGKNEDVEKILNKI
ncbi:MAG: TrkA family potassium uptake protein [Agathobacter sp.]|nr:TrkA family potassium uptake protein [Agathobacter sp.]MBQ2282913.1 TrkA family potassium uptake protein [Agathobacter sp.]